MKNSTFLFVLLALTIHVQAQTASMATLTVHESANDIPVWLNPDKEDCFMLTMEVLLEEAEELPIYTGVKASLDGEDISFFQPEYYGHMIGDVMTYHIAIPLTYKDQLGDMSFALYEMEKYVADIPWDKKLRSIALKETCLAVAKEMEIAIEDNFFTVDLTVYMNCEMLGYPLLMAYLDGEALIDFDLQAYAHLEDSEQTYTIEIPIEFLNSLEDIVFEIHENATGKRVIVDFE